MCQSTSFRCNSSFALPVSFKTDTIMLQDWEEPTVASSSTSSALPTIDEDKPMIFEAPQKKLEPQIPSFIFQGFSCLPPALTPSTEVALPPVQVKQPAVLKSCLKSSSDTTATAATTTTNPNKSGHPVHFGTISIRSYDVTVGDSPSCTSGVPVTCDWTYEQQPTCDLEEYLEMRAATRRKPKQLLLSAPKRWEILTNAGFDRQTLKQAAKQAWTTKAKQRLSKVWRSPAEAVMRKVIGKAA